MSDKTHISMEGIPEENWGKAFGSEPKIAEVSDKKNPESMSEQETGRERLGRKISKEKLTQKEANEEFENRLVLLFPETRKMKDEERDKYWQENADLRAHLQKIHKKVEADDVPWVFGALKEIAMVGQKKEILRFRTEDIDALKEIIRKHPEMKSKEGLVQKDFLALLTDKLEGRREEIERLKDRLRKVGERKEEGMAGEIKKSESFDDFEKRLEEELNNAIDPRTGKKVSLSEGEKLLKRREAYLKQLGYRVRYKGILKDKAEVLDENNQPILDEKTEKSRQFKSFYVHKAESMINDFLKEELRKSFEGEGSKKEQAGIAEKERIDTDREKQQGATDDVKAKDATESLDAKQASGLKTEGIRQPSEQIPIFVDQKRVKAEMLYAEARFYLEELRKLGFNYYLKYEKGAKGIIRVFFLGKEKFEIVDESGNPIKEGKKVEFRVDWGRKDFGEDFVNFLKEELENKIKEKKGGGEAFLEEEMFMRQELDR